MHPSANSAGFADARIAFTGTLKVARSMKMNPKRFASLGKHAHELVVFGVTLRGERWTASLNPRGAVVRRDLQR